MIGRRTWLRRSVTGSLSAWAAGSQWLLPAVLGQKPAPKEGSTGSRFTVRKPTLPSIKNGTRPAPDHESTSVREDRHLSRVLAPIRDDHHLPGLIGAVVRGDSLAAIGAAGIRKVGSSEPIQVRDRVHLGSCTKAMTATLIGMLVDDGLLTWSTTVRDVFPQIAPQLHPDFRAATLSHLLTHRSGLPHDTSWRNLPGSSLTDQRRAALRALLSSPPLARPGTVYAYSNAGYVLAGLMAEEVSGQPWEELMQERLFNPLRMSTAGFGPPGGASSGRVDEPWGHRETQGRVEPVLLDNAPSMGPAAAVHSSVPDWSKFASLHLRGAQGKARLLKPSTFLALHTPPPGCDYAGGWLVFDRSWAGGRALNHSGSNTYWYATIWIAPARGFSTLVATNLGSSPAEAACEEATQELIKYAEYLRPARATRR
jgi:CubicO group peptidase (beta-lactamase class C family)